MTTKSDQKDQNDDIRAAFEEALDKTGNGLYNILLVMTCSLILMAIGVDLFGFSLVVAAACDLDLSVTQKGILTSLPFIGILLVSYPWGYVSDTRGRRFTLVVPLLLSFTLSCISSLSPHWLFLGMVKFLCVCFACAANSATYTLVGESCMQRVRNRYMLLMTCLIILSPAVAGVLTYPTLHLNFAVELSWLNIVYKPWRLLIVVLALPSGIGALCISFFCESPKFLFHSGRKDEALKVLKHIYSVNHKGSKEYPVQSLDLEVNADKKQMSIFRAMYEQSAPLFRPPFVWRSVQLFYIIGVVYITNNSFLVWLPYILNLIRLSMESGSALGNICSLISNKAEIVNSTYTSAVRANVCSSSIESNVILTLIASQSVFAFFNFLLSYLQDRRRVMLISILCLSSFGGICLNLVKEPFSSVFFFMVFTCTCLGMGIMASYFVTIYPTTYRGMAACLSIMVGRSCTFIGINVVGNLIFNHCEITFYFWSLLVFSSAVAAWFLPRDKPVAPPPNSV